jgi:hypothetical protein
MIKKGIITMNNVELDVDVINSIIKNVIKEIVASKEQIFQIVDSIRNDYDDLKAELSDIRKK